MNLSAKVLYCCGNIVKTLKEISDEVLGFNGRQITNEWYDGEYAEATKVKKLCLPTKVETQKKNIS
jgi:hypothetical protein